MCELFAVSSSRCIQINDYLKSFYKHSPDHPHGWGLAIMQGNQSIIDKQPLRAIDSDYLKSILENPIIVEHVFGHIRLATRGVVDSFNCHPFNRIDNHGRAWTLIHNGTIFKYEALNKYITVQTGETDSERILMYIIDRINEIEERRDKVLSQEEIFMVLNSIITDLSKDNKLNLMLFNGEMMFVHTNTNESLYYLKKEDSIIFSTRPLLDDKWTRVPLNTLYGIKDGAKVYEGERHDNEYFITEEHIEFILNNLTPSQRQSILNEFGGLENVKRHIFGNQQ